MATDLRERLEEIMAEYRALVDYGGPGSVTDFVERLGKELTAERAAREAAEHKIEEAAVNCPSCGRHDFGLLSGPIQKCRELEARLTVAEAALRELIERCDEVRLCMCDPEADAVDGNTTRAVWRQTVERLRAALSPTPEANARAED